MPDAWAERVRRWLRADAPAGRRRRAGPRRALLRLPDARGRLAARGASGSRPTWRRRCARPSERPTGSTPDEAGRRRVQAFCARAVRAREFLADFEPFAARGRARGRADGARPAAAEADRAGVPDIYQGDELLRALAGRPRQPPRGRLGARGGSRSPRCAPARAARRRQAVADRARARAARAPAGGVRRRLRAAAGGRRRVRVRARRRGSWRRSAVRRRALSRSSCRPARGGDVLAGGGGRAAGIALSNGPECAASSTGCCCARGARAWSRSTTASTATGRRSRSSRCSPSSRSALLLTAAFGLAFDDAEVRSRIVHDRVRERAAGAAGRPRAARAHRRRVARRRRADRLRLDPRGDRRRPAG